MEHLCSLLLKIVCLFIISAFVREGYKLFQPTSKANRSKSMHENDDYNTDSTVHDDNSSWKDEDSSSKISSVSTRSQKNVKIEKKHQTNLHLKTGLHAKIVKRTWVQRKKLLIVALLCTAKKSLSVWLRSASNILS